MTAAYRFDTGLHGEVVLTGADGVVEAVFVEQPGCQVTISRIGPITHRRTPVGTRAPQALEVTLTGGTVAVRPRRARVTKRSYRVDFDVEGVSLDLTPSDLVSSEFRLSTIEVANNVMAEMTRRADGTIDMVWSAPVRLGRRTFDPPVPTREQLLVALAVAAALGTGGLSLTTIAMNALDALLP